MDDKIFSYLERHFQGQPYVTPKMCQFHQELFTCATSCGPLLVFNGLEQAHKLQDAQAEKMTNLQAHKLTSLQAYKLTSSQMYSSFLTA